MLFAELDATGWSIVIGAIGIIITQVVGQIISYLQRRDVAREVNVVKETLVTTNATVAHEVNAVAREVGVVKDALVGWRRCWRIGGAARVGGDDVPCRPIALDCHCTASPCDVECRCAVDRLSSVRVDRDLVG